MKRNKKTLIITSILVLIPMLAGIVLWNQLPDKMAVHFASDGTPNGWSSKETGVFGLPIILLVIHLFCSLCIVNDPKRANVNNKLLHFVFWICPVVSIFVGTFLYTYALGFEINMSKGIMCGLGILFIIIGNYLPKCKQNYSVGIKIAWTLNDEDNWNRTHRMAGFLWVICGIIFALNAFVMIEWLNVVVLVVMTLVPFLYSYILYAKKNKEKTEE